MFFFRNVFILLVLVLSQYACKVEKKEECSADCGGLLVNNPDLKCNLYNSQLYAGGNVSCAYNGETQTCEVVVDNCDEVEQITTIEVGLMEECDFISNICEDPYTCVPTAANNSMCLQECSIDSSVCENEYYCDTTNVFFDSNGICWPIVGDNETCLPYASSDACSVEGQECVLNGIGSSSKCEHACSGATVDLEGVAGGCSENEWCLQDQSGYVKALEYELNEADEEIDCSDETVECTIAENYSCVKVPDPNNTNNFQL